MQARFATKDDLMLLYGWLNDPLTRESSFDRNSVPLDTHKTWFKRILGSSNVYIIIVESFVIDKWEPLGQVRIDENREIHISLAPEHRGKGLSSHVLNTALDFLLPKVKLKKIYAHIKPDNERSIKAFKKSGFVFSRKTVVKGYECLEYVYERT